MRKWAATVFMCALLAGQAQARDMCELLRDKGILDELEYNECKAAKEKEEARLNKDAQEFARNWITYKEGTGFVINSSQTAPGDYRNPAPKPRFSFALGNRIQARYTFTSPDSLAADESSSFRIRRFKTFVSGNAFYPWLKYKTQVNWTGFNEPDTRQNTPDLEDAIADFAYFPAVSFQIGQYKVPFDRQELTSSGAQQFVDRAITNGRFTFARDQGVLVHGLFGPEKEEWLEYGVGVFNGNGRNRTNNDNPDHLGVGRIYWTPMGPFKYSESDTDNTPRPAVALGAAYAFNPVTSTSSSSVPITTTVPDPSDPSQTIDVATGRTLATATETDADIHRLTADVHFKWRGLSMLGDYFFESRDDKTPEIVRTEVNSAGKTVSTTRSAGAPMGVTQTHGFLVQAGYFLIPKRVEVAGRYAMFNPEGTDNRQEEVRGALNWYIRAHYLKLQTDFGAVTRQVRGASDPSDFEARAQFQLIF
jgi:phosphate-selective porin OprO/OprP